MAALTADVRPVNQIHCDAILLQVFAGMEIYKVRVSDSPDYWSLIRPRESWGRQRHQAVPQESDDPEGIPMNPR